MGPKKDTAAPISVRPDAMKGKSVIITGEIAGRSRKNAEQVLADAGAKIERSLNKKVQLVVLGENAGQNKLDKVEELGLETANWDDLIKEIRKNEEDDDEVGEEDEDEEDEEKVEKKPAKSKAKPTTKASTTSKPAPANKRKSPSTSSSFLSGKKVIISGTIPGHDRKSAQKVVEDAGAHVEKSLNKQVELLILGTNPGDDKLKKADSLSIETIAWIDLAQKLDIEVQPEKEVADIDVGDAPDSIEGMTVIISGTVEGRTRAAAQKLLESAGAKYAKSLGKSVELVVLGTNPGPDKMNKIAELGISTCHFDALAKKLEVDEKEPPKKRTRRG